MTVNRATLPQEYFDTTSALLLRQPEPMYLHGLLWKAGLDASFSADGMLGMNGREFGSAGAAYQTDAAADRLVLSDGLYDQTITVVPELGNAPGHTVRLNRPAFVNTTYTQASRTVASGTTISTTPIEVSSEQVPITLKRFAGPYDQANSRVAPIGVDRFDGSVMLHRPAQVSGLTLVRDFDRTIDSIVVNLCDTSTAANIIRPAGMTTDDTSAAAGSYPFTFSLLQQTQTSMDDANVPTYANGKRIMVLSPRQCQQLGQDAQFNRQAVFAPNFNPLFAGTYWKSIGQWDIFKSTTLLRPDNTNSIPIHHAQALAPGCIGSGIGDMPRTAYNSQDNYGETALVIWLLYAGFAQLDDRFLRSIRTD